MSEPLIIRSLKTATEAANTLLAEVAHLRAQLAAAYQENEALVEQHNEMDARLAAAIEKRAEVAEKAIANWRQYCDDAQREVSVSRMEMWSLRKRVASLEAQLAAVPDYVDYCAAAAAAGVMPDTLEIWLLSQQEEQP